MRYEMISADCHLDLCWLPPALFTTNASADMRERMPHVVESPKGPVWVTKKGIRRLTWGSDFPHPDGIWPDSREYIQRELGHLPADIRHTIVCGNAARLYNFTQGGQS